MVHGIGTAKDLPTAAFWLSLAAEQGHEHAVANRDYVLKLLSQSERTTLAQRLQTTPKPVQQQDKQASIR